jgi:hypothetical protein
LHVILHLFCGAPIGEELLEAIESHRPELAILQDPLGHVAQRFWLQAQRIFAASAPPAHQTSALQDANVLAEAGERHRKIRSHIGNSCRPTSQAVYDRATRWIGDGR